MLKIKNSSVVPPGGWKYTDPDTKAHIHFPTYLGIVRKIGEHRAANNIPMLSQPDIEVALCNEAHPDVCYENGAGPGEKDRNPPGPVKLSGNDAINGTRVIYSHYKSGGKKVEPEVAEARARICAECEFNVDHDRACKACVAKLAGFIASVVKGESVTSVDSALKVCGICKCMNKAQVWVPYEHLQKGITEDMRGRWPKKCWKNPENNASDN